MAASRLYVSTALRHSHSLLQLSSYCQHVKPTLRFVYQVRKISSSFTLCKDPNTPHKAGDKGPGRNYRKKMAKKAKKTKTFQQSHETSPVSSGEGLSSLLEGMRDLEVGQTTDSSPTPNLMDILADTKMVRREPSREKRKQESQDTNSQFLDPSAGPRLGLFEQPRSGVAVMPSGKPTYAEIEVKDKLRDMYLLRPWSHYDDMIEGRDLPYPRQFPIDNEQYDQGEEAGVGFEDHVLLDHLLAEFPKRGPVRHFMELVVTGLSKNPHYTAQEKRDVVNWYQNYFSQFSAEELQSMSS